MADMKAIMRFNLNGIWNVPGFDPMTTEEFADLLRRIDQAQFVAQLQPQAESGIARAQSHYSGIVNDRP